jgi:HlyD family secretion protein
MATGRGSRRKKTLILVGLGLALAGGGFAAFRRPSTVLDPSKIGSVEKGDVARSVVATGKVQPLSKVDVKSKASGIGYAEQD